MTIFVYGDTPEQAASLAGFAKEASKQSKALVFDPEAAAAFASCGVDEVLQVSGEGKRPEDYAKALASYLAEQHAEMFLAISSATGRELAAKVAGYANAPMISDASALVSEGDAYMASHMMFGGSVVQSQNISEFVVVTANKGLAEPASGDAPVFELSFVADTRIAVLETSPVPKAGVDIAAAEHVICVGNGIAAETDLQMIREFAAAIQAEIGCTRGIAEERKWLPLDTYIGISGANLSGSLYVGIGVSGQVQHVYGVRNAKTIVAINKDDQAPIFREADYGIVGDLYEIIPELIKVFS